MLAVDSGTFVSGIVDAIDVFPQHLRTGDTKHDAYKIASDMVATVCITHPHLDHVSGLVINSVCFHDQSRPKKLAGSPFTIDTLKRHIFNGQIWPNLTNEGPDAIGHLHLQRLVPAQWDKMSTTIRVSSCAISHGENMESTVYFLQDMLTNKVMCIWGDVEPDSESTNPRNKYAWRTAAGFYRNNLLAGMLIECSFPSSHNTPLYGHMSPKHLVQELVAFANSIPSNLHGFTIVITHIKDPIHTRRTISVSQVIIDELYQLAKAHRLACKFVIAKPGLSIKF